MKFDVIQGGAGKEMRLEQQEHCGILLSIQNPRIPTTYGSFTYKNFFQANSRLLVLQSKENLLTDNTL